MSSTTTSQRRRDTGEQTPVGMDYVLTEEERAVFKECSRESFWYRSVPFAVIGMSITQALISRGKLAASPTFGSLPKLCFAVVCGYLAGQFSYTDKCREKFMRLENSPLAEAIKRNTRIPARNAPPETSFEPTEEHSSQMYDTESPVQMSRSDNFSPPVESYMEEEEGPTKKAILYEDLRLKNRENYEVTLTQKAEMLLKPSPEEPKRPKIEVKNIYGDTWEE